MSAETEFYSKKTRNIALFFLIVLVIGCTLAAYILLQIKIDPNKDLLDNTELRAYLLSFSSSMLNSIIFFSTISAAYAYLTKKSPSQETIGQRVKYLFASKHATEAVLSYSVDQIDRFASFTKYISIELYITDWNKELNSYKVIVKNNHKIVNLYADRAYKEQKIHISTIPDNFDDLEIKGQILLARVTRNDAISDYVKFPIDVTDKKYVLVDFRIEPEDHIFLDHHYWLWFARGQNFWINITRYTESISIRIENKANVPFSFKAARNLGSVQEGEERSVGVGGVVEFKKIEGVEPSDLLIFTTLGPTV